MKEDLEIGLPIEEEPSGPVKQITLAYPWAQEMVEYFCPECGRVERVTELMSIPMHRHQYGSGPLQSGLFRLVRRTR